MPEEVISPSAADPPFVPFTDQVTFVFALPVTVATNACVLPSATVGVCGSTVIVIGVRVGAARSHPAVAQGAVAA